MQRSLLLLLLAGCSTTLPYNGAFNVPSAVAVTSSESVTAFDEPIGFVANRHGGQISLLATKQGRFLADQPNASFVRGNPLPTGQARVLTSIAVWAPSADRMTVYTVDQSKGQMLEVPYIVGSDEKGPITQDVSVTDPVGSGAATMSGLTVKKGFTSTEDWTVTYDGDEWHVLGSRSGRMHEQATSGVEYTGVDRVVAFTIEGEGQEGDTFTFSSDSGLIEHDLGFIPTTVSMSPDQALLAVAGNAADGTAHLAWFDPDQGTISVDVILPAGARPGRMDWANGSVYIADNALPAVYTLELGQTDLTSIPLPWPVLDVAPVDRDGMRRLFVTPDTGRHVYAVNLDSNELIDLNPWSTETSGMDLRSPVRGLSALPHEVRFIGEDDDGERLGGHALAVSLYSGAVVYMNQDNGCLLTDGLGPRTATSSQFTYGDYSTSFSGISEGPTLAANYANTNHVVVNNCAGVAPSESWSATYRQGLQAWEVEGAASGLMTGLAYDNVRYTSDNGEISFLIEAGASPAREGFNFGFQVQDGVVRSSGDQDADGAVDIRSNEFDMLLPADPVAFSYEAGPEGDREVRSYVLVPAEGADHVVRVGPETGLVGALWR